MDDLISDVISAADALGVAPATILVRAGLSGHAWARWQAGGSCTMATADKVRAHIRAALAERLAHD